MIARFGQLQRRALIDHAVAALPNLEARSYRNEQTNRGLAADGRCTRKGAVDTVLGGRRGYLIVDGRDLRDGTTGDVVVERGLARQWGLKVGDPLTVSWAPIATP